MPRKVFTAGEVLAAADVNEFLMDQSVMTFASSAARGSAIGTATEGMVTWLNDENALQVYDGTQWNGLAASGGNAIINGAFEINQRNFTSTTTTGYTFDRWLATPSGGTVTYSSQAFTPGSAPISGYEAKNFIQVATSGQSASGNFTLLEQRLEDARLFAGQTVTISFFARSTSGTPKIALEINQEFGTGGSPSALVVSYAGQVTTSTGWTRYSVTTTIPSLSGKTFGTTDSIGVFTFRFWLSGGSDFNARTGSIGLQNNTIQIWGVQLEAGPTANVFRRNANSLQGELAACQRYYYRANAENAFGRMGFGMAENTTTGQIHVKSPVTMRIAPTSIDFPTVSTLRVSDISTGQALSSLSLLGQSTTNDLGATFTVASGLNSFRPYFLEGNNSSAAFIGFSAEL